MIQWQAGGGGAVDQGTGAPSAKGPDGVLQHDGGEGGPGERSREPRPVQRRGQAPAALWNPMRGAMGEYPRRDSAAPPPSVSPGHRGDGGVGAWARR